MKRGHPRYIIQNSKISLTICHGCFAPGKVDKVIELNCKKIKDITIIQFSSFMELVNEGKIT